MKTRSSRTICAFSLTRWLSHKLIGAAFADYARILRSIGLREGAALWASRAGGAGKELLEELFQGDGGGSDHTPVEEEAEANLGATE
ncbi:hypothetical protein MHYP_G00042430 [Metynnis hypsauchen]